MSNEQLFALIEELVLCHSPSGVETEIDQFIFNYLTPLNREVWQDQAGNIIIKIPSQHSSEKVAITAHKDEIGMIVKSINRQGRLNVRKLGGSFPWVYGEGVVDILGDDETISGILSFGSRHVSHESPQKAQQETKPLNWENAWVETKCSLSQLATAGIREGSRVVVGKHRKRPIHLNNYIASYTLDNKASIAILLELATQLTDPKYEVYLVASAKEEVGALGALYFSQNNKIDGLIALEICPLSLEYPMQDGICPVLLSQDGYGIYDEGLNQDIRLAAEEVHIPLQLGVISGFGSDASIAMKFGHVARGACLSFPTQNTHGYEIAHLDAIANCFNILLAYLQPENSKQ
ncbi:MAG: M42 family metallopeptidase [Microcystaceae cyanobacterium]